VQISYATAPVKAVQVPRLCENIQEVNERAIYTVPGTHWNTLYPDCVRNIHVVNRRGYTVPGTH